MRPEEGRAVPKQTEARVPAQTPGYKCVPLADAARSPSRRVPRARPLVTMEARALWLLVVVLVLGSSSWAAAYQGLCEYCSGFLFMP